MIDKFKKVFTFWKQKEKPKIHWWSTIQGVEKVTPIVPAKEYIPDWWKRVGRMLDDNIKNKGSVKNCPSFPEYITQGFVVPLWTDVHLNIEHDKYEWHSPDNMFNFSSHGKNQFLDFVPQHVKDNSSIILKPNCPWRVKTPPGWSVWQLPMYYHFNNIFETLPGIIWSDIHHEINQQMMIKKYGEFVIKRGTPLAMYVPYERNKYTYDVSGPNTENAKWANESYIHVRSKFRGGYKLHQAEVKKCPIKH
mgnify:CR=1 FL=1|tara:strand:+ start:216 stop:962 length:747 start_codon:yes stop_codon:yes gene_type:complete